MKGEYDTSFLSKYSRSLQRSNGENEEIENMAMIAAYVDYLFNLEENSPVRTADTAPSAVGASSACKNGTYYVYNKERDHFMEMHIGDRVADVTLANKEGKPRGTRPSTAKPCVVDIVMAENGSCSILHDGNSYNAELIRGEGGKSYDVNMFYRSYHVDVVDTQAKYLRMKKHADERLSDKIVAPMPGKVVSIPVQPGDELKAGDIAIVLEAMKMQSNYKVSSDCRVKNILVTEGEAVQDNQTLIELELIQEA